MDRVTEKHREPLALRALASAAAVFLTLFVFWEGISPSSKASDSLPSDWEGFHRVGRTPEDRWTMYKSAPAVKFESSGERRTALRSALRAWHDWAHFPTLIADIAAQCSLEEAASAVLESAPDNRAVVIDVSSGRGNDVSLAALTHGADNVVVVESDPHQLSRIRDVAEEMAWPATRFVGVHGLARENSVEDKDETNTGSKFVVEKMDSVLDKAGISKDAEITVFHVDAKGFEWQVLRGASRAFQLGVFGAVIVRFDPKALGKRRNAISVLDFVLRNHFKCVHLAFNAEDPRKIDVARFAELPLEHSSKERFVDFAMHQKGWTNLFCLRPRVGDAL